MLQVVAYLRLFWSLSSDISFFGHCYEVSKRGEPFFFWSLSRDEIFSGRLVQKNTNNLISGFNCSENNPTFRWQL